MSETYAVYQSLKELGMPMNLKGYPMISRAVSMCLEQPELTGSMSAIYKALSEEQGVPVSSVVRNILYCVQTTLGNSTKAAEYFGERASYTEIKPNEFIAGVCEHIRMTKEKEVAL